jgi:hypothetical protein
MWQRFSTWFNQKWVQVIYSVLTMTLGVWMYLSDNIVTSLLGILLILASLLNVLTQFIHEETK